MRADGKKAKLLTEDCEEFGRPTWSADDKEIYYTATRNGATRIWVMKADGSGPRPVVTK
jgi:Tol biopolymer transport system component